MSPRAARVAFAAQPKLELTQLQPAVVLAPTPPKSARPSSAGVVTTPRSQTDSSPPLGAPLDTNPLVSLTLEMDGVPLSLTIELRSDDSPNTCRPVSCNRPSFEVYCCPYPCKHSAQLSVLVNWTAIYVTPITAVGR